LIKSGAGTLLISAANTYTGTTTVNGGVLAVDGDSLADAGDLIIDGGMVAPSGGTEVINKPLPQNLWVKRPIRRRTNICDDERQW
jgi:autotransporter-associated beta strand protein